MNLIIKGAVALALGSSVAFGAVLATVNGENITTDEINIMLAQNQLPPFEAIEGENRQKLIDSMIERKLIYQNAKKSGVEKSDKYKKAVTAISENIAIDVWMEEHMKSLPASDTEARKLYLDNIDKFKQPEQVRARHILVEKESEAVALIKELNAKPVASRENAFSELAKTKSTDKGSGANGGDLGYFPKEQMVKEFSDAAFALKSGQMTNKPVKSAFGYHIIFVVDKKEAKTVAYEEVSEKLKDNIRMQKFEMSLEKLTSDLKQNAKITYPKK